MCAQTPERTTEEKGPQCGHTSAGWSGGWRTDVSLSISGMHVPYSKLKIKKEMLDSEFSFRQEFDGLETLHYNYLIKKFDNIFGKVELGY